MAAFTTGQYVKAIGSAQIDTDGVKRYVALLSQTGTDAPVATVLENSLGGTVVWTRIGQGQYLGTLAGVFTANKTTVFLSPAPQGTEETLFFGAGRANDNVVSVTTSLMDFSAPSFNISDDVLSGTVIEIRVYS